MTVPGVFGASRSRLGNRKRWGCGRRPTAAGGAGLQLPARADPNVGVSTAAGQGHQRRFGALAGGTEGHAWSPEPLLALSPSLRLWPSSWA